MTWWWSSLKSQERPVQLNLDRDVSVCIKFYNDPSNSCWGISLWSHKCQLEGSSRKKNSTGDQQTHCDSSSGEHECLYKLSWYSITRLLRYFSLERSGGQTHRLRDFAIPRAATLLSAPKRFFLSTTESNIFHLFEILDFSTQPLDIIWDISLQ